MNVKMQVEIMQVTGKGARKILLCTTENATDFLSAKLKSLNIPRLKKDANILYGMT